ncbi:MAG: hypothetical protein C4K58_08520 [Flavobacteriaceae bacterium]|nr:MAG: hypothetical protein C4K58_08520 [Flavobacteriaceae bacterium]
MKPIFIFCFLSFHFFALAQEPSTLPPPPAVEEKVPSALKNTEYLNQNILDPYQKKLAQYMYETRFMEAFREGFKDYEASQDIDPALDPYVKRLFQKLEETSDLDFVTLFAPEFKKVYTESDLDALIGFYKKMPEGFKKADLKFLSAFPKNQEFFQSKQGKSLLKKSKKLNNKIYKVSEDFGEKIGLEVLEEMIDENGELKEDVQGVAQ